MGKSKQPQSAKATTRSSTTASAAAQSSTAPESSTSSQHSSPPTAAAAAKSSGSPPLPKDPPSTSSPPRPPAADTSDSSSSRSPSETPDYGAYNQMLDILHLDRNAPLTVGSLVRILFYRDKVIKTNYDPIIEEHKKTIAHLTQVMDNLEQHNRCNNVRLYGIPEADVPRNEDTDQLVVDKLNAAGLSITTNDICRSHRLRKPTERDGPRPIICRFTRHRTKERAMRAKKSLRQLQDIYINEDLTRHRSGLFYRCRTLRRDHVIDDTFTWDGKIFVVRNNETTIIKSLADITDLERNYL